MGAIPRSRTLSRSETAHKVTILNVCGSDLLIAIFVTVHAENRHRMNRWGCAGGRGPRPLLHRYRFCRIKASQSTMDLRLTSQPASIDLRLRRMRI